MQGEDDIARPAGDVAAPRVQEWLWAWAMQAPEQAALLLDAEGVVQWANPAAHTVLDDPAPVGRPVHAFFVPEDAAAGVPALELALARSRGWAQDDRWMQRADGTRFWASGATTALNARDGEVFGFVKLMRNQTHSKMQLETLRKRAVAGTVALATVAHELRNPLSAMAMATSVIEHGGYDAARLEAAVSILQNNVRLATRLVQDLQDASRSAVGKLRLQVEPVVLDDILRAAIAVACGRAGGGRQVELFLMAEPVQVAADPLRLQQVFVNLIGNALRYTAPEGRIWVSASQEGTQVQVEVADTGIGIAADMLDVIFDMFTQADGNGASGGMGIGLALVKELVESHGGSVQAQSDGPGTGSKFIVRLPMQRD